MWTGIHATATLLVGLPEPALGRFTKYLLGRRTRRPHTIDGLTKTDSNLDRPVPVVVSREPRAIAESLSLSLSSPTRQPIRSPKWVAAANHAFASSLTMRNSVTREIFFEPPTTLGEMHSDVFLISIFVRAARLDRFLSSLTRIQRAIYKISLLYFIFLRFFNSQ